MQRRECIVLQNNHLTAGFSTDGKLIHFASKGSDPSLIAGCALGYFECQSRCWYGNTNDAASNAMEVVSCTSTLSSVTSVNRSKHIKWSIRYELTEKTPLMLVTVRLKTTGHSGRLMNTALPRFTFAPSFNNVFEDERDLYSDGAELGRGQELPCWRVFFQRDHTHGLILVTRSKADMAHFNVLAQGVELRPHHRFNYSTAMESQRPPLDSSVRATCVSTFEIGPWARNRHKRIVSLARLDKPVRVAHPPAKGKPQAGLKGVLFHAVDHVPFAAATGTYSLNKWMIVRLPWAQKGRSLLAGSGVRTPPLTFRPKLKGLYRVFVGIGNGAGICVRLSGDPETSIRSVALDDTHVAQPTPFSLFLSGEHRSREVEYGSARMDGRSVVIERFPNLFTTTVFDYIRFEKLSPAQTRTWETAESRQPRVELSGFSDIPDIAQFTDADDPDPSAYRANIWEHARCKFRRIFWRIDGQCSDFPSRRNTMRYISAKVHGIFHPPAKAYGRVLKKADILELAVESARKYGVELYGWMRFNNYSGNVQSDFFKKHPRFHEEWENGHPAAKLCLAIPEVRKHKLDILIEIGRASCRERV